MKISTLWLLIFIVMLGCTGREEKIMFAQAEFVDGGGTNTVSVSGPLTGRGAEANNTTAFNCYYERMECITFSISQIGPNHLSSLNGYTLPVKTWNDNEIVATDYIEGCEKTTITIVRKSETLIWVQEPANQGRASCKDSSTETFKWTIKKDQSK